MTALSDALLLKRFREGDEASFETLFTRHYDMVYGVLFRLTGTRAEAEDLAQEVFLKLYQRRLRYNDNVAGWLYRVAMNTGYNALRSRQRRSRREEEAAREDVVAADRSPTTEAQAARRETRRNVQAALANIKPRSARLLLLRELGFSYHEMADIVGVAPGSVGTLLARAQRAFEEAYAQYTGKPASGEEEG